ncbi:MAG: hypothetical protein ACYDCL_21585 [Myxococcales bacterium]
MVYDKLNAGMDPILGPLGVQILFVRSVRLAQKEYADLGWPTATAEGKTDVRALLRDLDPGTAQQAAEILFGTFLGVIGGIIGERLTLQILRTTWPTIVEEASE